jgi:flavin reductase (DIM6/NTAB) family NADH-FMN oxidoreductase RutF
MLQNVDPKTLQENVFSLIGDRWLLVTAGNGEQLNTMTASWGGLGVFWRRNVATIYVRPNRYTYQFLEEGTYFTLSFFPEEYREKLAFCGSKSGRDVNKVKECNFTVKTSSQGGAPYFEEADLVLVCRKLYYDDLKPEHFLDETVNDALYPQRDYHRIYIGEILEVLQKG